MDKGETNRQLRELVEQLKRENELLKAKIRELEARLQMMQVAHIMANSETTQLRRRHC